MGAKNAEDYRTKRFLCAVIKKTVDAEVKPSAGGGDFLCARTQREPGLVGSWRRAGRTNGPQRAFGKALAEYETTDSPRYRSGMCWHSVEVYALDRRMNQGGTAGS